MKKVLSMIITITMLITCIFSTAVTVNAENVDISIDSLEDVISFLDDYMPDTKAKRIEVYYTLAEYAKTDMGIETLEGILDGTITDIPTPVQRIIDGLAEKGADLDAAKAEIVFALNLIKGLKDTSVENSIENFETFRAETEANGGTEAEFVTCQEDLNDIYELLVKQTGRDKLASHNVGPNAILNLLEVFDGYVMLTDDEIGGDDFALSWVSVSFDKNVFNYITSIGGDSVNGVEDIFKKVIESANDKYTASEKAKMKNIMGEIGIYTPLTEATPTPEPGGVVVKPSRPQTGTNIEPGFSFPVKPTEPSVGENFDEVNSGLVIDMPSDIIVEYPDTENHWAAPYVSAVSEKKYFVGYDSGNFEPDWGITRQEMAIVLVRILGLEGKLGTSPAPNYVDVTEIAPWAIDYVAVTTELGIYEGYDDGLFRPEKIVTREELCAIMIRSMANSGNKVLLNYADRDTFADWSTGYIGKASYFGIVQGYPDGEFKPTRDVTRAEAAKMIYNYMQVIG